MKYDHLEEDRYLRSCGIQSSKRPLIVDTDVIAHIVAASNTYIDEEGDVSFSSARAKAQVTQFVASLERCMNATHTLCAMSDSELYRKTLCPGYKASRKPQAHQPLIQELLSYLRESFTCVDVEGAEADDVCMLLSEIYGHKGVIATIDKDLDQIPGEHVNPKTRECHYVEPEEAELLKWTQSITGDATDEFYGLPGVGKKGAHEILDTAYKVYKAKGHDNVTLDEVIWYHIVDAFEDFGFTELDAYITAACAHIGERFVAPRLITENDL